MRPLSFDVDIVWYRKISYCQRHEHKQVRYLANTVKKARMGAENSVQTPC